MRKFYLQGCLLWGIQDSRLAHQQRMTNLSFSATWITLALKTTATLALLNPLLDKATVLSHDLKFGKNKNMGESLTTSKEALLMFISTTLSTTCSGLHLHSREGSSWTLNIAMAPSVIKLRHFARIRRKRESQG